MALIQQVIVDDITVSRIKTSNHIEARSLPGLKPLNGLVQRATRAALFSGVPDLRAAATSLAQEIVVRIDALTRGEARFA